MIDEKAKSIGQEILNELATKSDSSISAQWVFEVVVATFSRYGVKLEAIGK